MRLYRILSVGLLVTSLFLTLPSHAALRLRIEDVTLGQGAVLTDNGVGDVNPAVGIITFVGPLPGGMTVNVTTGTSDPPISQPPAGDQSLHLNNLSVNTVGPAVLRVILENDGYVGSGGPGLLFSTLGGVLTAPPGSTALFQSSVNPTNAVPILGPDTFPPGPLAPVSAPGGTINANSFALATPGAFSSTTGPIAFTTGALNSLYLDATVNFAGPGSISFDTVVSFIDQGNVNNAVPLPPAMIPGLVMGAGLFLRRRG